MKKLISKTVIIVILGLSVFISCKKEDKVAVLPPRESMLTDFSNFQTTSTRSALADDTTKYNNWTSSAVTVGFWNVIVFLNSAIPVAAFTEAFNHQGIFVENATWRWTYSITIGGITYSCKLEGTVNKSTTDWKMYLSKTGGFGSNYSDFLWFTGTSSNDATNATWHLNRGPDLNGRKYLDIDWVKDISLKYTLVDVMEVGVGNYLEYDKINEAGLDAQFIIQTVNPANNLTIQWKTVGKNGRVKCQNWYGDLNWHCWGVNYKNSICK